MIKTKHNTIWIDEEGFLVVKADEKVELDINEIKACFEAYKQLGINPQHKVLQILDVRDILIDSEARHYVAEVGKDYFLASAIISGSLAVRILANFFGPFTNNAVPYKMFPNEEEARAWLRTFK